MIVQVRLFTGKSKSKGSKVYDNKVNGEDYTKLALLLKDLKHTFNLPIDKAIKEINLSKSDWDASLGF